MNARHAALAVVLSALAPAAAAEAGADRALDWDCSRQGAPSWAEVEQVYGYADFYRVHHARVTLNQFVKRACKAGGAVVTVTALDLEAFELAQR